MSLIRTIESRALETLGIGADEERAYRLLLSKPASSAHDLSPTLGLTARKMQRVLDALAAKGFATHSAERPRRYRAVQPEFAVEAIVNLRQVELERARAVIPDLGKHAAGARDVTDPGDVVELVPSRDAERRIFNQAQSLARDEVVTLVRPPMRITRLDTPFEQDQYHQTNARARGVRYRSIVDTNYLALPGAPSRVREESESGEEIRVYPALPLKIAIFDRRVAFIPLDPQQPEGATLLVRSSALLDALYALFEKLWEQSTPIAFTTNGMPKDLKPAARWSNEASTLLPLLAAGLNDKAIAHELDVSSATLNRRIAELMKRLGTRTRFQLGWRAALETFPERIAPRGKR